MEWTGLIWLRLATICRLL